MSAPVVTSRPDAGSVRPQALGCTELGRDALDVLLRHALVADVTLLCVAASGHGRSAVVRVAQQRATRQRRQTLDAYFRMLFFLRVTEEYDPAAYVTTFTQDGNDELEIALLCLDAAGFLNQQLAGRHAAVFFSATLNPMDYYQSLK